MTTSKTTPNTKRVRRTKLNENQFHAVWTEFALQEGYTPEHKKMFQATLNSLKKKKLIT